MGLGTSSTLHWFLPEAKPTGLAEPLSVRACVRACGECVTEVIIFSRRAVPTAIFDFSCCLGLSTNDEHAHMEHLVCKMDVFIFSRRASDGSFHLLKTRPDVTRCGQM